MLDRIERAERRFPFCDCGAPTVPVERHGALWLTCRADAQPRGALRRLLTLDFGHFARPILDLAVA